MAQTVVDVPVNGVGAEIDLTLYGRSKTFIAQGSDLFDAFIECKDANDIFVPVGRIKGRSVLTIDIWGEFFRVRRVDDGANTDTVTMTVQANTSPDAISRLTLNFSIGEEILDVSNINEPFTILITSNNNSADVLIKGIIGTDSAPLARLGEGEWVTIDSGVDIDSLAFEILSSSRPGTDINVTLFSKNIQPYGAYHVMAKLGITAGEIAVVSQSNKATAFIDNPVHVGVGLWRFSMSHPANGGNDTWSFVTKDLVAGTATELVEYTVAVNMIASDLNVYVLDSLGNPVDPTAFRFFVVCYTDPVVVD